MGDSDGETVTVGDTDLVRAPEAVAKVDTVIDGELDEEGLDEAVIVEVHVLAAEDEDVDDNEIDPDVVAEKVFSGETDVLGDEETDVERELVELNEALPDNVERPLADTSADTEVDIVRDTTPVAETVPDADDEEHGDERAEFDDLADSVLTEEVGEIVDERVKIVEGDDEVVSEREPEGQLDTEKLTESVLLILGVDVTDPETVEQIVTTALTEADAVTEEDAE